MFENLFTQDTIMGFQVGGGLSSAIGSYYAAKGQQYGLEAQAKINEINAHLAELSAQSAMIAGQKQASNQLLKTGQLKSSQRASMAANGIDISETKGTSQDVLNSTDFMGQTDANNIESAAIMRAWGYRTEATNYTNAAIMARGQKDAISPGMQATSSLLTSAGPIASSWYTRKYPYYPTPPKE